MRKRISGTPMEVNTKLIMIAYLLYIVPNASADIPDSMETSGAAMQIIAYLLGMSGSVFLAAILWKRGTGGSESWKQLSIAMILFGFWNIIMIFKIMIMSLYTKHPINIHETSEIMIFTLRILDPVVEVMAFIILFFGLKDIIRKMLYRPWVLFNKVEEHDE